MTSSFISRQKPSSSSSISKALSKTDEKEIQSSPPTSTTESTTSFIQVIDDWKNGIIPSNDTIKHYIEELRKSPFLFEDYKLSSSGKKMVLDLQEFTSLFEELLVNKNKDELLQRLIAHLRLSSRNFQQQQHPLPSPSQHHDKRSNDKNKTKIIVGPRIHSRQQIMSEYQKKLEKESLETLPLLSLLLTSEEFQCILMDSQIVAEKILKTGKFYSKGTDASSSPSGAIHDIDDLENGIKDTKTHLDSIWNSEQNSQNEISFPKILKIPHKKVIEDNYILLDDLKGIILRLKGDYLMSLKKGWNIIFNWGFDEQIKMAMPVEIKYDANIQASRDDFISILESLSNNTSLKPLLSSIENIKNSCENDYELRDFFQDWQVFIKTCINDCAYMNHPEYHSRGNYLLDKTDELMTSRYRQSFKEGSTCIKKFVKGLKEDPQTDKISKKVKSIFGEDLYRNQRIKGEIVDDFKNVFIPNIMKSISNISIPQIEIENKDGKVFIEGVVIPSSIFEMSNMTLQVGGTMHLFEGGKFLQRPQGHQQSSTLHMGTCLYMKGMKGEIKNVHFKIARNTFPSIRDAGYCDIRLGGKGMEIKIDLDTKMNTDIHSENTLLEAVKVTVKVDKIRLRFKNVEHSFILSLFKPYIQSQIRGDLERGVCSSLSKGLHEMNKLFQFLTKTVEISS